jgi:hypothetical protein
MNALLSVINYRIVIILVEVLLVYWGCSSFNIDMKVDFNIISIAIVFPLVFSITGAYQKRQDALKGFSILGLRLLK